MAKVLNVKKVDVISSVLHDETIVTKDADKVETITTSIKVRKSAYKRLKQYSVEHDLKMYDLLSQMINDFVDRLER